MTPTPRSRAARASKGTPGRLSTAASDNASERSILLSRAFRAAGSCCVRGIGLSGRSRRAPAGYPDGDRHGPGATCAAGSASTTRSSAPTTSSSSRSAAACSAFERSGCRGSSSCASHCRRGSAASVARGRVRVGPRLSPMVGRSICVGSGAL
jgi:hypothetical protein